MIFSTPNSKNGISENRLHNFSKTDEKGWIFGFSRLSEAGRLRNIVVINAINEATPVTPETTFVTTFVRSTRFPKKWVLKVGTSKGQTT